jgi:hypothetical protein
MSWKNKSFFFGGGGGPWLYEGGGLQPTSYINIILENGHEIVHISLKKWTIYKPANRLQQIKQWSLSHN